MSLSNLAKLPLFHQLFTNQLIKIVNPLNFVFDHANEVTPHPKFILHFYKQFVSNFQKIVFEIILIGISFFGN